MDHCEQCPDLIKKVDEMHVALLGTLEKRGWITRLAITESIVRIAAWALGTLVTCVLAGFGFWIFHR